MPRVLIDFPGGLGNEAMRPAKAGDVITDGGGHVLTGGAPTHILTFAPGYAGTCPLFFASWPALMTYYAGLEGLRIIRFDDDDGAVTVPAGTYAFDRDTLWEGRDAGRTTVTLADGVVLTGLRVIRSNLDLVSQSAAPIITMTNQSTSEDDVLLLEDTTLKAQGLAEFIRITREAINGDAIVYLDRDSQLLEGNQPVVRAVPPGALWTGAVIVTGDAAVIEKDTLANTGATGIIAIQANSADANIALEHAGYTATLSLATLFDQKALHRFRINTTAVTTNTIADPGQLVRCDTSGGGFNVTLPNTAKVPTGTIVAIKKVTADSNAITVLPQGVDTIDGVASATLSDARESQLFVSDGGGDWMNAGAVEVVTLDDVIDNQGATPATQTTHIIWRIDDDRVLDFQNAAGSRVLLRIAPAVADDAIEIDVDRFDVDVPDVDFDSGTKHDTSGQQVNVGTTAGQIDSASLKLAATAGVLELSAAAADLKLKTVRETPALPLDDAGAGTISALFGQTHASVSAAIKYANYLGGLGLSTVNVDIDFAADATKNVTIGISRSLREIVRGRLYIDNDPGAFAAWATMTFYNKAAMHGEDAIYRAKGKLVYTELEVATTGADANITPDAHDDFSPHELVLLDNSEHARLKTIADTLIAEDTVGAHAINVPLVNVMEFSAFPLWNHESGTDVYLRISFIAAKTVSLKMELLLRG